MFLKSVAIYFSYLFLLVCLLCCKAPAQISDAKKTNDSAEINKSEWLDVSRNRKIPVAIYSSAKEKYSKSPKRKIAIINHGYGIQNMDYSFIANNLVSLGYIVVSIQHELSTDAPMPKTGNIFQIRKPFWERGAQNILFVIQKLKQTNPKLDFKNLLLIGHSNGGDTIMLFAQEYSDMVSRLISLDNRRMLIPRTKKIKILSIRSSDQVADEGVLPSLEEQRRFNIKIIKLKDTIHNDMLDGATELQKKEINVIISEFLKK